MPQNSKGKFVLFSIFVPFVIVALLIAAIAAPDWMTFSSSNSDETKWGLFSYCTGSSCTMYKDSTSSSISLGSASCTRSRNDVMDRMNASAGLLLAGILLAFFTAVPQSLHALGCTTIAKRGHSIIAFLLSLATTLCFIGVVVYGASTSNWVGCGRDVCDGYDNSTTSCGVGYSFVFAVVGTLLLALATAFVLMYTYKPDVLTPTGDAVFVATVLSIASIVLIAIGVGTNHWHVIIPDYVRGGLFKRCTTTYCKRYHYDDVQVTTTTGCVRKNADMASYTVTSATFLIAAVAILGGFTLLFLILSLAEKPIVMFTRSKKRLVVGLLIIAEMLQLVGFLLQENLYNSWYYCGSSLCDQFTGYCAAGMSYGFVITTLVLTFLLIGVHYFELNDWCCFQERFASGRHNFTFKEALQTITDRTPGKPLGTKRPAPPVPPTATALAAANQGAGSHEPSAADTTLALPPGEWEYDSVSGYYWCEQIYLFYDPETRQYYDPATDQWINTDVRENSNIASSGSPAAVTVSNRDELPSPIPAGPKSMQ